MTLDKIIENLEKIIGCDRDMYSSICKDCSECVNHVDNSERTETLKSALEGLKVANEISGKEISDFVFDMK
jgi:hypothetical protein